MPVPPPPPPPPPPPGYTAAPAAAPPAPYAQPAYSSYQYEEEPQAKAKKPKKEKKEKKEKRRRSSTPDPLPPPPPPASRGCCCWRSSDESAPLVHGVQDPESPWQTMKTRRMVPVWLTFIGVFVLIAGLGVGGYALWYEFGRSDSTTVDCTVAVGCAGTPAEYAALFVEGGPSATATSLPCVSPTLVGALVVEDLFGKKRPLVEPTTLVDPTVEYGRRILPAFGPSTLRKLLLLGQHDAPGIAAEVPPSSRAALQRCAPGECALSVVVWQRTCEESKKAEAPCLPLARWHNLPGLLECVYGKYAPQINATQLMLLEQKSFSDLTGCNARKLGPGPTWSTQDVVNAECSPAATSAAQRFRKQVCCGTPPRDVSPTYLPPPDGTLCPAETSLLHLGQSPSAVELRIFLLINDAIGPDFDGSGYVRGPAGELMAEEWWAPNALIKDLPGAVVATFYNGTPSPPTPSPSLPAMCGRILNESGCVRGGGKLCGACVDSVWRGKVPGYCAGYPAHDWCLPLDAGCSKALDDAGCGQGYGSECRACVQKNWGSSLANECGWTQEEATISTRCESIDVSVNSVCGQVIANACPSKQGAGYVCDMCITSEISKIEGSGYCKGNEEVLKRAYCNTVADGCREALLSVNCFPGDGLTCTQCVDANWDGGQLTRAGACGQSTMPTIKQSYCGVNTTVA
eukprot:TRINITY_DN8751_c1_g3_i1.p1 TRINITY_DN8751_c1_g3~~TRINITY_DN8751_c1_g3_i1.p1  ORF type:complete len:708 (+),score=238.45 TRINITY_DN8751_c1_g3_i1:69-2126(+)